VDNLNQDRATVELEQHKLAISGREFDAPAAKPSLEISQACHPRAMASTSFSAESSTVEFSFVSHPLPSVFQPIKYGISARRNAT